ncbi:MAG: DNA mismatch repair endonuclease MutL [Flavobacteriales bacterium]
MTDLIKLLPDSVANQIAAGEVIQRPASAVKELLENAIDAGATSIQLIVKDAGRTLVQVIDNGCGMSETDARMCFERHATSKIKSADDLFAIKTKGFRGEAMASIAAVSQVEMRSKRKGDALGTKLIIEGSEVLSQEPVNCPEGSNIQMKNLFFNVPARRNFLKSNQVEMRHIMEELERVALAHPDIAFSLNHNGNEVVSLPVSSLKQRIIGIFGKSFNEKLVPIEEETDIVGLKGFIGKPDFAKKVRGEQFFFVNNRFVRSNYLNHAVNKAYDELIKEGMHVSFFLFLEVSPSFIDINIHPTKTEIKFEDERAVYSIINSTVRRSLGKHNLTPSLDFEQENSFNAGIPSKNAILNPPTIKIDPNYNPFHSDNKPVYTSGVKTKNTGLRNEYESLQKIYRETMINGLTKPEDDNDEVLTPEEKPSEKQNFSEHKIFQLHRKYIVSQIKSGVIMIDQQKAHERILYEKLLTNMISNSGATQVELFPETIEFSAGDYQLILDVIPELTALGFDISDFGNGTIVVNGIPADSKEQKPKALIESFLNQYKNDYNPGKDEKTDYIAQAMARSMSIKSGRKLEQAEMQNLIDELFSCEQPNFAPNGKPALITLSLEEIEKRFNR